MEPNPLEMFNTALLNTARPQLVLNMGSHSRSMFNLPNMLNLPLQVQAQRW